MDEHIKPLVYQEQTVLKDTTELNMILESTKFSKNCFLVTADVYSLYTNISVDKALLALDNLCRVHKLGQCPLLVEFSKLILHNNYIYVKEFDVVYHQVHGLAMGSPFAVSIANIFMCRLECPLVSKFASKLELYKRFIDDLFFVWRGTLETLNNFLEELNNVGPMIKLTWVISEKSVDFLDLHIFKDFSFQRTGKLSFSTYQKAFNKYLYIPFKSFHPAHNKKAFIRGELIRYVKNSSTISSYLSMRKRFYYRLRLRGYPPRFLIPVFVSVSYQDRHKCLKPLATTKKTGKPPIFFKTQLNAGHLRIKYIIKKYLPNTNVVTCYKRTRTLKHLV